MAQHLVVHLLAHLEGRRPLPGHSIVDVIATGCSQVAKVEPPAPVTGGRIDRATLPRYRADGQHDCLVIGSSHL